MIVGVMLWISMNMFTIMEIKMIVNSVGDGVLDTIYVRVLEGGKVIVDCVVVGSAGK